MPEPLQTAVGAPATATATAPASAAAPSRELPPPTRQAGLPQPFLGLAGLGLILVAVAVLGFLPSRVTSLTTTITIITFGLPLLVMMTIWWQGRPFARWSRAAGGAATLLVLAGGSVVLALVGQGVTGRVDPGGLFGAEGALPIFPYGFVLAATIFVTMLQLTFPGARKPLDRLGPVGSGLAALAISWLVGIVVFTLLLTWAPPAGVPGPPPPPAATSGPVYALDWPAMLLCVVVFQMVFFLLLQGWPLNGIRSEGARTVAAHVFTLVGGAALYAVLTAVGVSGPAVSAVCGSITAATLLVGMVFENHPFSGSSPGVARLGATVFAAALTVVLLVGLRIVGALGYPSDPGTPPVDLWVAGVTLNIVAAFAIVHVAVFRRWPLAARG